MSLAKEAAEKTALVPRIFTDPKGAVRSAGVSALSYMPSGSLSAGGLKNIKRRKNMAKSLADLKSSKTPDPVKVQETESMARKYSRKADNYADALVRKQYRADK